MFPAPYFERHVFEHRGGVATLPRKRERVDSKDASILRHIAKTTLPARASVHIQNSLAVYRRNQRQSILTVAKQYPIVIISFRSQYRTFWRGGRVADGAALEMLFTRKVTWVQIPPSPPFFFRGFGLHPPKPLVFAYNTVFQWIVQ